MAIAPALTASNGETLLHLARSGAGIACLSDFLTRAERDAGTLVPVLQAQTLAWAQPVWAVFYRQAALAPRVTALVNFLAARLAHDVLDA